MERKRIGLGILVLVLVFGMAFFGCDNGNGGNGGGGNGGNTDPKTLVITGMTAAQVAEASDGGFIGLFPVGTSEANVEAAITAYLTGQNVPYVVAAMDFDYIDPPVQVGTTYTVTVPLYNANSTTVRWTGSGTFDVYNAVSDGTTERVYKAANVSFTNATTTITASQYTKIYEN